MARDAALPLFDRKPLAPQAMPLRADRARRLQQHRAASVGQLALLLDGVALDAWAPPAPVIVLPAAAPPPAAAPRRHLPVAGDCNTCEKRRTCTELCGAFLKRAQLPDADSQPFKEIPGLARDDDSFDYFRTHRGGVELDGELERTQRALEQVQADRWDAIKATSRPLLEEAIRAVLTRKQARVIKAILFQGKRPTDVARSRRVTKPVISKMLARSKEKLSRWMAERMSGEAPVAQTA